MIRPWDKDDLDFENEEDTEDTIREIQIKFQHWSFAFCHCSREHNREYLKKIITEQNNKEYEFWTILEDIILYKNVIEIYIEYIEQTGRFIEYKEKFESLLTYSNEIKRNASKFYRELERKFALQLIKEEKGEWLYK